MKKIILSLGVLFLAISSSAFAYNATDFVMTVKTDNSGSSSDTQFKIPTINGSAYNYDVDCNDDGT
jgi:hypothetical protein